MRIPALAAAATALLASTATLAGAADVVEALAIRQADGSWRFDVTVRSEDTGWDAYANRFEILTPSGTILATRELLHPHVEEQPFTRSVAGVVIPPDIDSVLARAHHSTKGYDGEVARIALDADR